MTLRTVALLAAATAAYVGLALALFAVGLRRYQCGETPVTGG